MEKSPQYTIALTNRQKKYYRRLQEKLTVSGKLATPWTQNIPSRHVAQIEKQKSVMMQQQLTNQAHRMKHLEQQLTSLMGKKDRSGGDQRIVQAGNSRTDNPSYPLIPTDDVMPSCSFTVVQERSAPVTVPTFGPIIQGKAMELEEVYQQLNEREQQRVEARKLRENLAPIDTSTLTGSGCENREERWKMERKAKADEKRKLEKEQWTEMREDKKRRDREAEQARKDEAFKLELESCGGSDNLMYARKKVKYYKEKAEEHRNGLREMLKKQKEYENMVAKEEIGMGLKNSFVDVGVRVDARLALDEKVPQEKKEEKKAPVSNVCKTVPSVDKKKEEKKAPSSNVGKTLPSEDKNKEGKKALVSEICITKKVPSEAGETRKPEESAKRKLEEEKEKKMREEKKQRLEKLLEENKRDEEVENLFADDNIFCSVQD